MSNKHSEQIVVQELNPEQRQAVFSEESVVILAGAGSGKTTVLASRVVYLMWAKYIKIDEILTLTFTKKATAEMFERIYSLLQKTIITRQFEDSELSEVQIKFLISQQEQFHKAQISTLDSFSYKIAQIGLSRMNLMSDITIEENLEESARNFVEDWLLTHPEHTLHRLRNRMSFDALVSSLLVPYLCKCSCIDNDMREHFQHCSKELTSTLQNIFKELEDKCKNILELSSTSDYSSPTYTALIQKLTEMDKALSEMARHKEYQPLNIEYRKLGRVNDETARHIKQESDALKDIISEYDTLSKSYNSLDFYETIYLALQDIADDWHRYQYETLGSFTYEQVSELARHTLKSYKEVRDYYKTQYKYIIIDEFQDNNLEQKELLYLLDDEDQKAGKSGKYFFVGDPKQSIYKFRGADINAFLSLIDKDSGNTQIKIKHNYRSNPSLVALFNRWFSLLFRDENLCDNNIIHRLEYTDQVALDNDSVEEPNLEAILSSKEHEFFLGHKAKTKDRTEASTRASCLVDILQIYAESEEDKSELESFKAQFQDNKEIEARMIVNRIECLLQHGIQSEDIVVLSPSRAIFPYIAQLLRMRDIAYSMDRPEVSLRQDVGIDFYAWLTLLVYPEDRAAYTTLLRSPLAHISDDLAIILLATHHNQGIHNLFSFAPEKQEDPNTKDAGSSEFTGDDKKIQELVKSHKKDIDRLSHLREKYLRARRILEDGEGLIYILYHFWLDCGYRYILMRNTRNLVYLKQFDLLKDFIATHRSEGVVALLDRLGTLFDGGELNLESETAVGIRMMTVHKAKGLEFDYVIFSGMGSDLNRGNASSLPVEKIDSHFYIYLQDNTSPHFLLSSSKDEGVPHYFYNKIKQYRKKEKGEQLRQFYVALTRAKKALVLTGVRKGKIQGDYQNYFHILFKNNILGNNSLGRQLDDTALAFRTESEIRQEEDAILVMRSIRDEIFKPEDGVYRAVEDTRQAFSIEALQNIFTTRSKVLPEYSHQRVELSPSNRDKDWLNKHSEKGEALPSLEVDPLLLKHNMHTAFGTYCHFLLNNYCIARGKTKAGELPQKLETQLLVLKEDEKKLFVESAEKLCGQFLESAIGTQILDENKHSEVYTEHPFLLWNEAHRVFVRGIIDLLILCEDKAMVVDYKVDRTKYAERYKYQISAYELATKKLCKNRQVECYLYYLRDGRLYRHETVQDENKIIQNLMGNTPIEDIQVIRENTEGKEVFTEN